MISENLYIFNFDCFKFLFSFFKNWYLTTKYFNYCVFIFNMKYICARKSCGKEVTKKELSALPGIKCSPCGFRILYKKRPDVIKRIKCR